MAEIEVYDHHKNVVDTITAPDSLMQTNVNEVFLHQVLVSYESNKRQGTAQTKTRNAVNGSSKKMYRQKGTGRARMGEANVAHHRGGATQFGPSPRSYRKRITKTMRQEAFRQTLSLKAKNENLYVLNHLDFPEIKTRQAVALLSAFNTQGKILFIDRTFTENATLSIRNLSGVCFEQTGSCSPLDIFKADYVFLTKAALDEFQQRYAKAEGEEHAA